MGMAHPLAGLITKVKHRIGCPVPLKLVRIRRTRPRGGLRLPRRGVCARTSKSTRWTTSGTGAAVAEAECSLRDAIYAADEQWRNRTRSPSESAGTIKPRDRRCRELEGRSHDRRDDRPRLGRLAGRLSRRERSRNRGGDLGDSGQAKTPPRKSTGWGSANSTSASGSNRSPRAGPAATSSAPTSPGRSRARTTTASGSTKREVRPGRAPMPGKSAATSSPATPSGGSSPPARNSKSTGTSSAPTRRATLRLPNGPDPEEVEAEGGGIRVGAQCDRSDRRRARRPGTAPQRDRLQPRPRRPRPERGPVRDGPPELDLRQ